MEKNDILVVGVGGQGTILTGKILGQLALDRELDIKMAETHGMAQRGGSVVTHVRLGKKVFSPLIPSGAADFLLSFEGLETARWITYLRRKGTVIYYTGAIPPLSVLSGREAYPEKIHQELAKIDGVVIPIRQEGSPIQKNPRVLNIYLLGVLAGLLTFSRNSWLEAMKKTIPNRFLEMNQEAFMLGWNTQKKTQ